MVSEGRFVSNNKQDERVDLKVPKLLSKNTKKRDLPAFLSGMMSVSKLSSSPEQAKSSNKKQLKEEAETPYVAKAAKLPRIEPPMIADMNNQIQALAENICQNLPS